LHLQSSTSQEARRSRIKTALLMSTERWNHQISSIILTAHCCVEHPVQAFTYQKINPCIQLCIRAFSTSVQRKKIRTANTLMCPMWTDGRAVQRRRRISTSGQYRWPDQRRRVVRLYLISRSSRPWWRWRRSV
jgi:hypothetical protein